MNATIGSRFDVEPHLGVLRRYALVLTRDADQAEDLVQEALVRAIARREHLAAGPGPAPLAALDPAQRPCLAPPARAGRGGGRQRARRRRRARRAPPAQLDRVELGETMAALMTLPEEQREVLVLVAIEGLSYKDAAEILGMPIGTLMSRLGRARAALRAGGGGRRRRGAGERPALRVVR